MCFCQLIFSMISSRVAPFLRRSMVITWAVLLPGRGAAADVERVFWLVLAFLARPSSAFRRRLGGTPHGANVCLALACLQPQA